MIEITGPLTSAAGLDRLDELEGLWKELQQVHLAVVDYRPLVEDAEASWQDRRTYYVEMLAGRGAYFLAHDANARGGPAVGYAFANVSHTVDDTFVVHGGCVEVTTLVVAASRRGEGIGAALLAEAEGYARSLGMDTLKIGVMSGNLAAREFYESHGYALGEWYLYRHLPPDPAPPTSSRQRRAPRRSSGGDGRP